MCAFEELLAARVAAQAAENGSLSLLLTRRSAGVYDFGCGGQPGDGRRAVRTRRDLHFLVWRVHLVRARHAALVALDALRRPTALRLRRIHGADTSLLL